MRLHSLYCYLHQGTDMSFYLRKELGAGNGFSTVLCFMLLNPKSILTASFVCVWVFFFKFKKSYLLSKELELEGQIKSWTTVRMYLLVTAIILSSTVKKEITTGKYRIIWPHGCVLANLKKKTKQKNTTTSNKNKQKKHHQKPPTGSSLRNHYFVSADGIEGCWEWAM